MPPQTSPVLTLLGVGSAVKDLQVTLDAEASEFCTIGRSQDNTICLPAVPQSDYAHVSRQHCVISFAADLQAWIVEDLQSTNGTAVREAGSRREKQLGRGGDHRLQVHDQLVLAGCDHFTFLVQAPSAAANDAVALERTVPLYRARQSCLCLLDRGGNRGVVALPDGVVVTLQGASECGMVSPTALGMRGFEPGRRLGEIEATTSGVGLRWLVEEPVLCNQSRQPAVARLHHGDLLTFPSAPGVSLVLHLPRAATPPSPFSALAMGSGCFTVGRDPGNDVVLAHPSISRRHARFTRQGAGWLLEDFAPEQATMVNGNPVAGSAMLSPGDRVTLGHRSWLVDDGGGGGGAIPVELQCLEVSYRAPGAGGRVLLHPLSFRVARGELLGIIGPSGSGKSTLLNLLAGKTIPSAGQILLNGRNLHQRSHRDLFSRLLRQFSGQREPGAGYVQQQDIVYANLSTWNLLVRSGLQAGLGPAECDARAREVLKLCQIEEIAGRVIVDDGRQTVSGGQLKRICIAIALMQNSTTLLVDEPISPLDHSGKTEFLELFRSLAQHGTTVILTIHDIHYLNYCHKILAIALGRLAYYGEPAHLESYFGVSRIEEVLSRLPRYVDRPEDQQAALQAEAFFRTHAFYAEYCATGDARS